jgi:hypothetical protein
MNHAARRGTTYVTDASRDLGGLSGPLAGAAAVGSLATSALPSLALTPDGKSEATDVAPYRGVLLGRGPRHPASFGIFTGCLPELLTAVGVVQPGRPGQAGRESP